MSAQEHFPSDADVRLRNGETETETHRYRNSSPTDEAVKGTKRKFDSFSSHIN